jgi:hypothetical protein
MEAEVAMTNAERIETASTQLERVQGGLDAAQVALEKAESLAVATEQVPRKLRRTMLILVLVALTGLAVAMVLKRKRSTGGEADGESA